MTEKQRVKTALSIITDADCKIDRGMYEALGFQDIAFVTSTLKPSPDWLRTRAVQIVLEYLFADTEV